MRAFDLLKLRVEDYVKAYQDKTLVTPVTCVDVTGTYLLAGYKSGQLALWDIKTNQLQKIISNVHESYVIACRVFNVDHLQ